MSTSHIKIALDRITIISCIASTSYFNIASKSCSLDSTTALKTWNHFSRNKKNEGRFGRGFQIIKGFSHVDYSDLFTVTSTNLRGHSMKLFKTRFVSNCGKFVFANRVVDEWNLLTEEIISSSSVLTF